MNDEMISDIADRQGWSNVLLLKHLLDFIYDLSLETAVVNYLRDIAFKENDRE